MVPKVGLSSGIVFTPTDDASVYTYGENINKNYGNKVKLRVRDEQGSNRALTFLRFTLENSEEIARVKSSGCDIEVLNATFKIQIQDKAILEASLWNINDTSWNEMTITGDNYPKGWVKRLGSKTNLLPGQVVAFSVTDEIAGLVNSNTNAITFGMTSTEDTANLILYSKERSDGGMKPQIKLSVGTKNCPERVCTSIHSPVKETQTTTTSTPGVSSSTTEPPTTTIATAPLSSTRNCRSSASFSSSMIFPISHQFPVSRSTSGPLLALTAYLLLLTELSPAISTDIIIFNDSKR